MATSEYAVFYIFLLFFCGPIFFLVEEQRSSGIGCTAQQQPRCVTTEIMDRHAYLSFGEF